MAKKFIDTTNISQLSALELVRFYKKQKQLQLKLAYEVKFNFGAELDELKKLVARRQKDIEHMAATAQRDREDADGLSYNEVTLSLH
jgi:hypothetical protein